MLKTKISILVFIWSALLFFLNLQYDLTDGYDEIIFWISTIVIFSVIIYQIFWLKYTSSFVLFEIFIVYLFLHLIYQVGYSGLRGSDSYIDYNLLKTITTNHNFSLGESVDGWPMIHIFSSITSILTKVNPLLIAKFLPSLISSIIVLPIYLLVYKIYKNKQVALFSCLIFGTIPQFISFEGLFVREAFALFIIILFFYLIYVSKQRDDFRFALLYIILVPVIVFSHHLSCFMFIILLSIYIVAVKVISYFYSKNTNMKMKLSGKININTIFMILVIAVLTYWIFHAIVILTDTFKIFHEFLGVQELESYAEQIKLSTPIVTLKGNIMYYGFYFFQFSFALILLIKVIKGKNVQKIEDSCFTAFLFFSIFYGFLALYILASLPYPQRFLPYGWMFGVIPLVGMIINLKKEHFKKIFVLFLTGFLIYNMLNIPPFYTSGNPQITTAVAGDKEYYIANTIKFPDSYLDKNTREIYYGYVGVVGAIYDVQGIEQRTVGMNFLTMVYFQNSSKIAIIHEEHLLDILSNLEDLKQKSYDHYLKIIEIISFKNDKNVNKICDLGNRYVLIGGE